MYIIDEVIFTQPIATRRAEFLIVWSFWIIDLGAYRNHMDAVYTVHVKGSDNGFVGNKLDFFLQTQLFRAKVLRILIRDHR